MSPKDWRMNSVLTSCLRHSHSQQLLAGTVQHRFMGRGQGQCWGHPALPARGGATVIIRSHIITCSKCSALSGDKIQRLLLK